MRTQNAPTIRLKNYKPASYQIETVDLDVKLNASETSVRSVLKLKRRKGVKSGTPLVLDGDGLELISVHLNGVALEKSEYWVSPDELKLLRPPKDSIFELTIKTQLDPSANAQLMGLYQSKGVYCTQCEAEGFRRITYFLDRPDVLSVYTVRLEADRDECPVLLSNGNLQKKGKLAGNRHYAIWHDPHPKPSYLFALVGGDLDAHSDKFTTASGRKVALNIFVEKGKAPMAVYAMDALKRSMVWDEENYGREYDLDIFNIVAVSDFNMGAMENKGLNVFNDKYVLADPDLATDQDYMHIEAIIAHEYFHNWTGNRITCRDWFQLCLKEGLTVYRDQEFSADMRSSAVQRIAQVRHLKASQFTEDAGPLAHSVRPEAYQEINNFYTATVYQKGSELVRMLATFVGPKAYRKSTDRYFARHDGEAAVVEDWLAAFKSSDGVNLDQFSRWYGQAGTPVVSVGEKFNRKDKTYSLTFEQSIDATPGQRRKQVVPIPIRFGLLDANGNDIHVNTNHRSVRGDVIVFDKKRMTVTFKDIDRKPCPSLLRGFSAPITLQLKQSEATLVLRAKHDGDPYNRWDALNRFAMNLLVKDARSRTNGKTLKTDQRFIDVIAATVFDDTLEPAFRAQALTLPNAQEVARAIRKNIDPDAVFKAVEAQQKAVGATLAKDGMKLHQKLRAAESKASEANAAGLRSLANVLLQYLVLGKAEGALEKSIKQFKTAENMSDRLAALHVLVHCQSDMKLADDALDTLYNKYRKHSLVVDKWFSIQCGLPGRSGLTRVKKLVQNPEFSLNNPNRVRAVFAPFAAANLSGFHRSDGKSYKFFADHILKLDKINPQIAARLLTLMNDWATLEPKRRRLARGQLKRIATTENLSRDVKEIVDRSLG